MQSKKEKRTTAWFRGKAYTFKKSKAYREAAEAGLDKESMDKVKEEWEKRTALHVQRLVELGIYGDADRKYNV